MRLYVGVYSLSLNNWVTGASVTIGTTTKTTTVTDGFPGTVLFDLQAGTYSVTASYTGHASQTRSYTVSVDNVKIDFYLTAESTAITVNSVVVSPASIRMDDIFQISISHSGVGSQMFDIYSDSFRIGTEVLTGTGTKTKMFMTGSCPQLCEGTHTIRVGDKAATLTIGPKDPGGGDGGTDYLTLILIAFGGFLIYKATAGKGKGKGK